MSPEQIARRRASNPYADKADASFARIMARWHLPEEGEVDEREYTPEELEALDREEALWGHEAHLPREGSDTGRTEGDAG